MSKENTKRILLALWLVITLGYLEGLREVNVKQHSLILFVYLAITSMQTTGGLKVILRYAPMYRADGAKVLNYVVGFIAAVVAAMVSIGIGAELCFFKWLSEPHAQTFSAIGFIGCVGVGLWLIAEAERLVKASNSTQCSI